jgi:Ser/Thr protein kinase RdoA (MazF antagonist)
VIPLHPDLPPGPHDHLGYPINFWQYVTAIEAEPDSREVGRTLGKCHEVLRGFAEPLPKLAILTESLAILQDRDLFPTPTQQLLCDHLTVSIDVLSLFPHQPLHGDAHMGNLMNTTWGLLWTDWEDTFYGPVEWDLASVIWNARILDEDHATVDQILDGYREAGGDFDEQALSQSLIARAAVMSAWYPILYPNPNAERRSKLQRRLDWLQAQKA